MYTPRIRKLRNIARLISENGEVSLANVHFKQTWKHQEKRAKKELGT
jgi:hypothetical protein